MLQFIRNGLTSFMSSLSAELFRTNIKPKAFYAEREFSNCIYAPDNVQEFKESEVWWLVFFRPPTNKFLGPTSDCPEWVYLFKDKKQAFINAATEFDFTDGLGHPQGMETNVFFIPIKHPSDLRYFPEIQKISLINKKVR
jgi:hypothetical protein